MSSNDFLSWDEIPAGYFSWEYTEEEIQSESGADSDNDFCVSPRRTAPAAAKKKHFKCPDCSNMYSSVSGFRGHVLRKHNKPYLKASDHRVEVESGSELHTDQGSSCLQESDLHTIIRDAINSMLEDPFLHMSSDGVEIQILGEDILSSVSTIARIGKVLLPVVSAQRKALLVGLHEQMWIDFHQAVTTERLTEDLKAAVCRDGTCAGTVVHFFAVNLCDAVAKSTIKQEQRKTETTVKTHAAGINMHDKSVLYYIAGNLIHSLLKKTKREDLLRILKEMCTEGGVGDVAPGIKEWMKSKDRGGLKACTKDFFELVQAFEVILRKVVDIEHLTVSTLATDKLKEAVLSDCVVQELWRIASGSSNHQVLLEKLITQFLTVRGFAIAKHIQRNVQEALRREKLGKKKSESRKGSSLRKNLKRL
ncbi:hypothetical protein BaRGS_00033674 [Batillaria attramentaria]|uniref:C2H2-type domain-containing protein n=1 Tax=Batillaria attramentaria TaxID=370345 RepID=A0ABD0JJH6_9CAEN